MLWFIPTCCCSLLLELVLLRLQSDQAKDLQILLLRRQLEIVQSKLDKPLRVSRAEKFSLALLNVRLKHITGQSVKELSDVIRIFQPQTVLKWHRELWFGGSGHTSTEHGVVAQEPTSNWSAWCCSWRVPMIGGTARSRGNCANWGWTSAIKPLPISSSAMEFRRFPNVALS